ncbi:MAG TPA: type VI secretion system tip protein VgrG [Puia sp.]|jgi:Rhs element Vgr protein|nr:type VI secretion system tip protein VgrG [Puia sp.]
MPENKDQATDEIHFKVLLNGAAMNGEYKVVSLRVEKAFSRIAGARLVLADGDPSLQDFPISSKDDACKPGSPIEIRIGYHEKTDTIFKGYIVSHAIRSARNKPSYLILEARDQAYRLHLGLQNQCYTDQSDSDIMEAIAKKVGYAGSDVDVAACAYKHKQMVQFNTTNWDYIVSRAEMNGMLVLTSDNQLSVKKPDTSGEPSLEISYGVDVIAFDSGVDARSQIKEIKAHAWNYQDQRVEDSPDAEVTFKESGNWGGDDLADALKVPADNLIHSGGLSDEELSSWGNSKLMRSRLAKICGRVCIKGTATILPGQLLKLKGFSERFNGPVLVTGIIQQYDKSIWETEIQFGLPAQWFHQREMISDRLAAGLLPGINGLQIGVVLQLENDPDKQDRIKIQLPLVDSQEGIWARVACLDAGDNRGSFFRPEIKDELIIGFLNDDPRYPVVLGMLNSGAKPAPIKAKDSNPQKGFVTRSKLKVLFDDEKKVITIETPKGKTIKMDDDGDSIELSDQHSNKLTMGADGITMESGKDLKLKAASGTISLEGLNIEQKADAKYSAEGNAQATLQSSGQTVVKGSIVNIN